MKGFPSIELLNSTHEFPCVFTFKVIGRETDGFLVRALQAVRTALGIDTDPKYSFRQTQGGDHIAITIDANVASAEQVLTVYHALAALDGVLVLL